MNILSLCLMALLAPNGDIKQAGVWAHYQDTCAGLMGKHRVKDILKGVASHQAPLCSCETILYLLLLLERYGHLIPKLIFQI